MIDPLMSLSFAIHENKGVYALLLGSGVSRAAGVPTGWDLVLDLARKLAQLESEDVGTDPAGWFRKKYRTDPDYSKLLDALCKTPSERQQVLRAYFEPTEADRNRGIKRPSKAHHAVAWLMAQGFVRLVLTTNFDRLLEQALADLGVTPVVISTADATEGSMPLAHQTACIVKLHGDYLDTRIKNTVEELGSYDPRMERLLDQALEQFGLLVCGWSAQWDIALRAAVERAASRRFTLFWASKGTPTSDAQRLIALKGGTVISIDDADSFLPRVQQLVGALEHVNRPHPISVEATASLAKRYLADEHQAISLTELVHDEIEKARDSVVTIGENIVKDGVSMLHGQPLSIVFEKYRGAVERVQAIAIQGGAWGSAIHHQIWPQIIERLAPPIAGHPTLDWLRMYAPMVLIYSFGVSSVSHERLDNLYHVLYKSFLRNNATKRPLVADRFWFDLHTQIGATFLNKRHMPRSDHLFDVLRDPLRRVIPDDARYEEAFDRLECLVSIAYADLKLNGVNADPSVPHGRFTWKENGADETTPLAEVESELKEMGVAWPPLRAGFCNGSCIRADLILQMIRNQARKLGYT